jgi:hypothetical protein
MVLKGRKLDDLRAQVARQKATHQRDRQRVLLLWAFAGGGALAIGWFAGLILRPQAEPNAQFYPTPPSEVASERATRTAPVPLPCDDAAEDPAPEPAQEQNEAPAQVDASAPGDVSHTVPPSDDDTFTLDDLPPD